MIPPPFASARPPRRRAAVAWLAVLGMVLAALTGPPAASAVGAAGAASSTGSQQVTGQQTGQQTGQAGSTTVVSAKQRKAAKNKKRSGKKSANNKRCNTKRQGAKNRGAKHRNAKNRGAKNRSAKNRTAKNRTAKNRRCARHRGAKNRPANRPSGRQTPLQVGTQFHGVWSTYNDAQRAEVLDRLKAMGATWVRIDISWAMLQPEDAPIDPHSWGVTHTAKVIRMAHERGLKVLGMFWLTPAWANDHAGERSGPHDPAAYGRALAWATNHWKDEVAAWEVWNEPNSGDFFVGADPVRYTRLLCSAYSAVRRSGSGVRIVYGGTMHNDSAWIERTYRAGVKGCFDVMSTHPYVGPSDRGPHSGDGSQMWDFLHLRAVRSLMLRHGDRSPVWLTEMGWSSHANTGREAGWERGVTEQQQAQYSTATLQLLKQSFPWVHKIFFYNERAKPGDSAHQQGYGIMRGDLTPKPVYHAMREWIRRN